jgi:hypothetical protein
MAGMRRSIEVVVVNIDSYESPWSHDTVSIGADYEVAAATILAKNPNTVPVSGR